MAFNFNVQDFRTSLAFDGARPSLFNITMSCPPSVAIGNVNEQITFKARAASLPGDSVSSIVVNYFGREIKVAGTRTFPDWSITVINDEDFLIRNTFERWMSSINSHVNNLRSPAMAVSAEYQTNAVVRQYAKTGEIIKTYNFVGIFPTDVAAIDLDWASGDQIEEFGITFAYQWWESLAPVPTTDSVSAVSGL